MADAAPITSGVRSSLLTSLRQSFANTATTPMSIPADVRVTNGAHASTRGQAQLVNPVSPSVVSDDVDLLLLDEAMGEVEQSRLQVSAQTQSPVQQPQVSQMTAPIRVPQEPQQPDVAAGQLTQALPQVVQSLQTTADYQQALASQGTARAGMKETAAISSPDAPGLEVSAGLTYVEQEKSPEIPVEVEGFLQKVEDHAEQMPQEIIIADAATNPLPTHVPKQSVVILPITQDTEQTGATKSPLTSIRWLVEWSRKLMKMFAGKIVYRQVEAT